MCIRDSIMRYACIQSCRIDVGVVYLMIIRISGKLKKNHMTCALFVNLVERKIWKGRALCLNYSRQVPFFAFRCSDCGIRRWIDRPDRSSISFSYSTELELHKDPTSLINLLLLLLFNGKPLVVGSLEARYGPLWTCENVKRWSNTQKLNLLMVLKT